MYNFKIGFKFGEACGHASDGKLGLGLGKPDPSIIRSEPWKLWSNGVDVEGVSGRGFGHRKEGRFR